MTLDHLRQPRLAAHRRMIAPDQAVPLAYGDVSAMAMAIGR
jgi:hypothetical protein